MKAATQLCQYKTIPEEPDKFSLSHHECSWVLRGYYPALKYFNHNMYDMKLNPISTFQGKVVF